MLKINTVTMEDKIIKILERYEVSNWDLQNITDELLNLFDVSDTLIAWEQFKKANWYKSEAIDVEKMLMDKFQAFYGR